MAWQTMLNSLSLQENQNPSCKMHHCLLNKFFFFFFFPVGLDSLTQVYQENSSTLQGEKKKKKCSELQNKFLKG